MILIELIAVCDKLITLFTLEKNVLHTYICIYIFIVKTGNVRWI